RPRPADPDDPPGAGGGTRGPFGQSLISQMVAPDVTDAPISALRPLMVPERWALRGCSIFMASRTTTGSPSLTSWPSSTATFTIVPCIGEARVSPEATGPDLRAARRFGLAPAASPVRARDMPSEAG